MDEDIYRVKCRTGIKKNSTKHWPHKWCQNSNFPNQRLGQLGIDGRFLPPQCPYQLPLWHPWAPFCMSGPSLQQWPEANGIQLCNENKYSTRGGPGMGCHRTLCIDQFCHNLTSKQERLLYILYISIIYQNRTEVPNMTNLLCFQ